MFQATQRRISEKIKSTLDSDALPFHEILDTDMVKSAMTSEGVQFKDRIYTPFVTLCLFLSQVLDQDHSCRAAVMRLVLWMALNDRKPCSTETTSYCEAPTTSAGGHRSPGPRDRREDRGWRQRRLALEGASRLVGRRGIQTPTNSSVSAIDHAIPSRSLEAACGRPNRNDRRVCVIT